MAEPTQHVKKAFEARVAGQLESSVAVDWEGVDFDPDTAGTDGAAVYEWIAPRHLGSSSSSTRSGERHEEWTFQIGVFVDTGFDESDVARNSTTRIHEIVDLVLTAFRQHDLQVTDAGGSTLGYLRFDEGDVVPLPGPGGRGERAPTLMQRVVTFNPTWIT